MYFYIGIVWFISGLIIAAVYTPLAGGTIDSFMTTVFFGPPAVFGLLSLYTVSKIEHRYDRGTWAAFWGAVTYCVLPILLNGASIVLHLAGYEAASQLVFDLRFVSLAIVAGVTIVVIVLIGTVTHVWRSWRSKQQPSSPPQHGRLVINQGSHNGK